MSLVKLHNPRFLHLSLWRGPRGGPTSSASQRHAAQAGSPNGQDGGSICGLRDPRERRHPLCSTAASCVEEQPCHTLSSALDTDWSHSPWSGPRFQVTSLEDNLVPSAAQKGLWRNPQWEPCFWGLPSATRQGGTRLLPMEGRTGSKGWGQCPSLSSRE